MKCPKCANMCMQSDTQCYACGTKLRWVKASAGSGGGTVNGKPPMAQRISMIFMALGAAILPTTMGHQTWMPKETIDWGAANWAGVGGACGAVFGMLLGTLLFGRKG